MGRGLKNGGQLASCKGPRPKGSFGEATNRGRVTSGESVPGVTSAFSVRVLCFTFWACLVCVSFPCPFLALSAGLFFWPIPVCSLYFFVSCTFVSCVRLICVFIASYSVCFFAICTPYGVCEYLYAPAGPRGNGPRDETSTFDSYLYVCMYIPTPYLHRYIYYPCIHISLRTYMHTPLLFDSTSFLSTMKKIGNTIVCRMRVIMTGRTVPLKNWNIGTAASWNHARKFCHLELRSFIRLAVCT